MLLFRSEEHVDRWLSQRELPRGATVTARQLWELARAWFGTSRLDPEFRRPTLDEEQRLFDAIGLRGDFWRLTPA